MFSSMNMGSLIQRDDFLSTLAHELRNPLAPLRTGIELLLAGGERPESEIMLLRMMERQLAQLIRLTDDVLDQSQVENGAMRLHPRVFELNEMVQSAIDNVRHTVAWELYDFHVTLPARPVVLYGDQERLSQALGNILNNAVKFTPPEGSIELEAIVRGDQLAIIVRDSGIGVEPSRLNGLLDMAAPGETGPAKQHGGLGIGLSVAKRIVELHSGVMRVESRGTGKGSAFGISMPITRPSSNRCSISW
jgi:signal transduction histidine kinase